MSKPINMDEVLHAFETLKAVLPELVRLRKMAYDAYIAEGFTKEEALVLCQNNTP